MADGRVGEGQSQFDENHPHRYGTVGGKSYTGFFLFSLPRFETPKISQSAYPGVASLAGQIEMFAMGKRELEDKFTRSEMMLLAWRSQEMSASLDAQTKGLNLGSGGMTRAISGGQVPAGLPEHFFRKDYDPAAGIGPGELDLRQVTGEEAYRYFSSIGVKLPIMGR